MFFGLIACLYYLCFILLASLSVFIALQGSRANSRSRLRLTFFLLSLSLLVWQATLFVEVRIALPGAQLWLSRTNFAAVVWIVFFTLRFVQEIPRAKSNQRVPGSTWCLLETIGLAGITLFTPFVDAAERIEDEHAISTFGPLFILYLIHVIGYLMAALILIFLSQHRTKKPAIRRQMDVVGVGILATAGIAFITNAMMPYLFNDFRLCDVGVISTLFFACSVGWATFMHRLFDVRAIIRETLVYGVLLALVLSAYSSAVFLITEYLTDGADKMTKCAVLVIAFSLDPIRRLLETKTDRLLFGEREGSSKEKKQRSNK